MRLLCSPAVTNVQHATKAIDGPVSPASLGDRNTTSSRTASIDATF
jgi:hypothetical protein